MTAYAFIDAQNLKKAVEKTDFSIDYRLFRTWLSKKFGITRAIMYFGWLPHAQDHYKYLTDSGFELIFRNVEYSSGRIKANVDICLTISALDLIQEYEKAYIITSDGDFYDLTERWKRDHKFGGVISPSAAKRCSKILKQSADGKIAFLPNIMHKFENRE